MYIIGILFVYYEQRFTIIYSDFGKNTLQHELVFKIKKIKSTKMFCTNKNQYFQQFVELLEQVIKNTKELKK